MTDANRPTETISPDRLRELIEVYNLQCFRGDTALALEELQRLRHYVATCGGTDNDGRCPMHHLAGVSKDTSEDDAFCGDCGEKLEAVRPGKHQHIGPCPSPGASELQGRQWAVFCDTCGATWSVQHYHAGKDRCEKCRNSSPEPEDLRAEVERLRVERYLCVLAMRCAMGAHHDGVDAMRERLEPVVARYGIATACAARAAISDADAACIEAQYSRSEIAGSSGEPRDECRCIPMAPRPWNFCTDCGGRIPETKGEKP